MTYKKPDSKDIVPVLENNTDIEESDSNDTENNLSEFDNEPPDTSSNQMIPVSEEVIEDAYKKLNEIFVKNELALIYNNMLDVGKYLVKLFYNNDYEKANKRIYANDESMTKLIKRFEEDKKYGNAPSRSWLYNAVSMARDNNLYENQKLLSTYGKLGHSHKIILLSVKNIVKKNEIIAKAIDGDGNCCTVAKFNDIIKETKSLKSNNPKNKEILTEDIPLDQEITEDKLKDITKEKLFSLISNTTQFKSEAEDKINIYTKNIEILKNEMKKYPGLKAIFNLE